MKTTQICDIIYLAPGPITPIILGIIPNYRRGMKRRKELKVKCLLCGYEGLISEFYHEEHYYNHVDIYLKCPKCGYACELGSIEVMRERK